MSSRSARALLLAIALFPAAPYTSVAQQVIYENTSTPAKDPNGNAVAAAIPTEYGEDVFMGGTSRQVVEFAFEYYAEFFAQGDEYARVKFYNTDGGPWIDPSGTPRSDYPLPGTVIWDSGFFPVMQGYNTKDFTVEFQQKKVVVPDSFVWTIQFYGLTQNTTPGAKDTAGLLYYYFPTVGNSHNDIWEKRATTGWTPTVQPGLTKNNFSGYIVAIPEPSILALDAIAAAVGAWTIFRRRPNG